MPKRFRRDKDEKIRKIYGVFSELVEAIGYERVTTSRIAEGAGISVGIVYHYFPEGKPAIAAGLYERNFMRVMNLEAFDGSDPGRLETQIRDHIRIHRENMELYRAFDHAILTNRDLFQSLKRERREMVEARMEQLGGQGASEERIEAYLTAYNVVDAVIHRHLFVDPVFQTDEELVAFLTKLIKSAHAQDFIR
ncbi:MAG: TetR/AcrR family transcriptional regulator [Candidatus Bathyarchaeota archaeon]|nr:MAG: TetR/AcrR family transcriptional regulator [Candidatus Bathyarchaeota archaeon]